jgi:hypothetical protein
MHEGLTGRNFVYEPPFPADPGRPAGFAINQPRFHTLRPGPTAVVCLRPIPFRISGAVRLLVRHRSSVRFVVSAGLIPIIFAFGRFGVGRIMLADIGLIWRGLVAIVPRALSAVAPLPFDFDPQLKSFVGGFGLAERPIGIRHQNR